MHIIVIRHSIRQRGGDKLVLDYLNFLVTRGHSAVYWVNEIDSSLYIDPLIKVKHIPYPGIAGTIFFTFTKRFDAIVIVDLAIMAFLAGRLNRKNVIYLAQDWDVAYYKNKLLRKLTEVAYKIVLCKWAIPTIAVSEQLEMTLKQYKPKSLQVVFNGIDLDFFYRNQNSSYIALRKSMNIILLFARKDYRKGLDIGVASLKVLKNLRSENDWEAWFIGDEKPEMDGINARHFGFIKSDEQLRDILSAVDIYLVPSRSEGLSLLLLQSMACGCGIVTTTASSIIENEVHGLVSPIEDVQTLAMNLNRMVSDENLKMRLTNASVEFVKKFDIKQSRIKVESILQSIGKTSHAK